MDFLAFILLMGVPGVHTRPATMSDKTGYVIPEKFGPFIRMRNLILSIFSSMTQLFP